MQSSGASRRENADLRLGSLKIESLAIHRDHRRPCERREPQRERKALIAAARTLASALEQRPFFIFEAGGYGSLRSQGRPAERLYDATTDQRTAQFSHMR